MSEPITIAITRRVDPERADEVNAWEWAGQEILRRQPGYLGSGRIRSAADSPEWHMLFRFADAETLAAWEHSPERAAWVGSGVGLVEHGQYQQRTGIEGWFDEPSTVEAIASLPPAPPRWKQMIAIFLVFYPLSVAANYFFGWLIPGWPIWARALVSVIVVTPIMTYLALPFVTRVLRPWLLRGR